MFSTQGNLHNDNVTVNKPKKTQHIFSCVVGFVLEISASLYPNLFVVFDGAAAFPVEAEAHQVDTENAGEGFDARPLYSGPLCRQTRVSNVNTQQYAGYKASGA